jgi:hypothetical protein
MFLSMVAAPEPGRRTAALTAEMYVQRYNVAVSRAKDQVWLFHSLPRAELTNNDDMRFALLDYCYGVIERGATETTGASTRAVPEDERVAPFDSLFEQRAQQADQPGLHRPATVRSAGLLHRPRGRRRAGELAVEPAPWPRSHKRSVGRKSDCSRRRWMRSV